MKKFQRGKFYANEKTNCSGSSIVNSFVFQILFDEEALKKLDEIATNEGRTRSNIAAYIIRKYIEDYEAAKNKESLKSQITNDRETKIG